MTLRGIISPPRSRSSPRDNRPSYYSTNNNNAATTNPPSKPNYMSPCQRRPAEATAVNKPNELQRSQRIETTTQSTAAAKPTATRPTKSNNDNHRSSNTTSRIDPSKPTTKIKKSDSNSATKTATKTSTRPSSTSPRATTRSGPTPPSKTSSNVKAGAGGSGSRSELSSAKGSGVAKDRANQKSRNESLKQMTSFELGQQQDVNFGADPDVRNQLQQLSFEGKDLASIVLQANSIYESLGSDTKEECSSQTNTNAPRIFQIHKEITSHRQESNSSITSYFTKLKELWDELATYSDLPQCSCGAIEKLSDHTERQKAMQFLAGLNDSYSTICSQILLLRPFPTLERAYTVIVREEKRRELVSSLESVAAKVMQNNWLLQNGHSSNSDGNEEVANDQNEVTSFPIEPLLIDLGSPVRC